MAPDSPSSDRDDAAPRRPAFPGARKAYQKPRVESHRVFEVSLACIKIPGSPMCQFNIKRTKS